MALYKYLFKNRADDELKAMVVPEHYLNATEFSSGLGMASVNGKPLPRIVRAIADNRLNLWPNVFYDTGRCLMRVYPNSDLLMIVDYIISNIKGPYRVEHGSPYFMVDNFKLQVYDGSLLQLLISLNRKETE